MLLVVMMTILVIILSQINMKNYEIRFTLRIRMGRQVGFPNNHRAKQYLKMTSPFLSPCLYTRCSIYWKRPLTPCSPFQMTARLHVLIFEALLGHSSQANSPVRYNPQSHVPTLSLGECPCRLSIGRFLPELM